ncbi:hypothetical protein Scep_011635 [Stephania cephalantha]|uniref:Bulb-type lectin domain-containing protein n=1 Tax=Stephania cephalantha TaxID=152367 RepID=A0AAP0JFQ0_9MAGN
MSNFPLYCSIFISLILLFPTAHSTIPPSQTFTITNTGDFENFGTEYGADYRYSGLDVIFRSFPFFLCFYNTSNDAFLLSVVMGNTDTESVLRFVWDANRAHPVRENANLTFARDGNLVLRDSDGTVAWQTNTANKGVVGIRLLPNGNLVLYDSKNRYIWQSFDHPSDTLLVGQALRPNGPNKIVARRDNRNQSNGPYSLVLENKGLALYLQSPNSPNPLQYYSVELTGSPTLTQLLFNATPQTGQGLAYYQLGYNLYVNNSYFNSDVLAKTKYNSTLSILRLDYDGNLKIYTFYEEIDTNSWEVTYALFGGNGMFGECDLPSKCGALGVCDNSQCVGCPTPKGLLGWSEGCQPPKLPPCNKRGSNNVDYYKVVDVEHFLSFGAYGEGNATVGQCRAMCDRDCGCLGFFFWEDLHRCFLAPELMTLKKAYNTAHVGYIKKAK